MNIKLAKIQYRLDNRISKVDDSLIHASTMGSLVPWRAYKDARVPTGAIPHAEIEKLVGDVMEASKLKVTPMIIAISGTWISVLMVYLPEALNLNILPEWEFITVLCLGFLAVLL